MVLGKDNKPTQSPYIIALCQQKGGVGKTTAAVCLGTGLAQFGKNVLMLDLSPSGNLTASFGINQNRVRRSTTDLFQGTYPPTSLIRPTMVKGLNLIPAQISLNTLARDMQQEKNSEQHLLNILAGKDIPEYDIIILDCPPGLTLLSANALACADLAILPVICEYFSLQALESMHRMIKQTQESVNPALIYRLLISRLDHRAKLHKRVYAQIEEYNRSKLLQTTISSDIKLPESQLAGIPISIYAPNARAAKQYESLTQEILDIIK